MPNCCTEPVHCTNKVYSEVRTFRKQHQMLLKLNWKVPLLQGWKSQFYIKLPILLQSQWLISRCGHKKLARADILFPYIAPRPSHQCWNTPLWVATSVFVYTGKRQTLSKRAAYTASFNWTCWENRLQSMYTLYLKIFICALHNVVGNLWNLCWFSWSTYWGYHAIYHFIHIYHRYLQGIKRLWDML